MNENLQIKTVEVTYKVKVRADQDFVFPEKAKTVTRWTPLRHAVLLNAYMKWSRNFRGSKQEFAKQFLKDIEAGEYPIMERTVFDSDDWTPYTCHAIQSQLDWLAQDENKVITSVENSTILEFWTNNLLALTTKQKAEEARRSMEKKASLEAKEKISAALQSAGIPKEKLNIILDSIEKEGCLDLV